MLSHVFNLIQGKVGASAHVNGQPQGQAVRSATNNLPRRRQPHQGQHGAPYSPFFFMALIVTVISSIAFVGLLTVAIGAG